MKFIIARSTVLAVTSAVDELNATNGTKSSVTAGLLAQAGKLDQLENFNVSFPDRDIQIGVNDEIVLRYLALYVKTYKLVHPIVVAAVGMWNAVQSLIKSDCDELVAFVLKRKE